MAIAQHRSVSAHPEQTPIHWQTELISPRISPMSNPIHQPLIFSIDHRFAEQHLTTLDLSSKSLRKIEKLPNDIDFNVVLLDHNDIMKIEHLDTLTHLVQVKSSFQISSTSFNRSFLVINLSQPFN